MREYILDSAPKIVIIAAIVNIISLFITNFGPEYITSLELSFSKSIELAFYISIFQLVADGMFWFAIYAIVILLDSIYHRRDSSSN